MIKGKQHGFMNRFHYSTQSALSGISGSLKGRKGEVSKRKAAWAMVMRDDCCLVNKLLLQQLGLPR